MKSDSFERLLTKFTDSIIFYKILHLGPKMSGNRHFWLSHCLEIHIYHTDYGGNWPWSGQYDLYVDIKLQVSTEEYLDKDINLEAEIILGEPGQLYFPLHNDYFYFFTLIHTSHIVHWFSFFSANIGARITNRVIFKIYSSMLLKNFLTFNHCRPRDLQKYNIQEYYHIFLSARNGSGCF